MEFPDPTPDKKIVRIKVLNMHYYGYRDLSRLYVAPNIGPFPKAYCTENSQFFGYKFQKWLIYIFFIMSLPINKFNKVNNFHVITK